MKPRREGRISYWVRTWLLDDAAGLALAAGWALYMGGMFFLWWMGV